MIIKDQKKGNSTDYDGLISKEFLFRSKIRQVEISDKVKFSYSRSLWIYFLFNLHTTQFTLLGIQCYKFWQVHRSCKYHHLSLMPHKFPHPASMQLTPLPSPNLWKLLIGSLPIQLWLFKMATYSRSRFELVFFHHAWGIWNSSILL